MTLDAKKSILLNRDRLTMASKLRVAEQTVGVFDRLSYHQVKEERLLALGAAFTIMCEAANVNPGEVFTYVSNLMKDERHSERRDHRFAAMKFHVQEDILRGH